jgi:hypothetical protein
VHPQGELAAHLLEQTRLEIAAGGGIADDPDLVSGGDLRVGQVANMPENASDRRPETMDDPQFLGHGLPAVIDQKRRSRT